MDAAGSHNPPPSSSVQEGLHPASELARFFPDLVRNGAPLFPPAQSPPPPSMYPPPASFGYINGQPVPLPTQPAPTQALPTPDLHADLPASPYYSNMYLARQNSQPLHYPPASHTPPPQPYHTSPPPYHASPSAYHPVSNIFQSPNVPSPVIPHPTASPLPESKSKAKKDKQPGTRLTGKRIVYNLDHQGSTQKKQLEATPITLYSSEDSYNLGCLIAANKNYICYAIRGEMVRVLSRHASSRALMRGHTGGILELSFFEHVVEGSVPPEGTEQGSTPSSSEGVDLLATTAKDGNIFLWKINSPSAENISPVQVLHIFSTEKKVTGYFHRVRWHPTDSNVLAAVSVEPGGGIYIFNISSLIASAQNKASPQCDIDQFNSASEVRILQVPSNTVVQDIVFSPSGTLLAAGSDDGRIRVWDLQTNECIYDWLDNIEDTVSDLPSPSPISSILFPSNTVIVSSTHKNSTVHLWSLPHQIGPHAQPTCLQSLAFKSEKKEFLGHLSFDPCGNFLFLASVNLCVGFIIHLDAGGRGGHHNKDKDNRVYTPKFDYLTEFEVTQPILSFTVGVQTLAPQTKVENEEAERKDREYVMQLFCVQTKAIQIHQTSTEHCYSASKQAQEDDSSGPLTQIGKVGDQSPTDSEHDSANVRPPLSASAEKFAEYNQHQQNLWLSHSVEARRDSYVPPEEEYQDPMLSPTSTTQIPIPADHSPSTQGSQSSHEQPSHEQPHKQSSPEQTSREPSHEPPSHEQSFHEQSSREQSSHEQPSETSHEQSSREQPSQEREQPSHESSHGSPHESSHESSHEPPSHEKPSQEQPPQEQSAQIPHEQPSQEQPSQEQPSYEQPSHEQPSHEQPSHEQPSQEQSSQEQSSQEQSSHEQPSQEQPPQPTQDHQEHHEQQSTHEQSREQPNETSQEQSHEQALTQAHEHTHAVSEKHDLPPDNLQSRNYLRTEEEKHAQSAAQSEGATKPIESEDKLQTEVPAQPAGQTTAQAQALKANNNNKRGSRKGNAAAAPSENAHAQDSSTPQQPKQQPAHAQKQKTSAPVPSQVSILHRNPQRVLSPQKEDSAPRAVSPNVPSGASPLVQDDLRRFEANMMAKMEKLFVQQLDRQYARLDKERQERERMEKERQEKLLAVISQTLNVTIQQQLERIVRKELQSGVEKLAKDIVQTVEAALVRNVQEALKKSMQGVIPKTDALFKDALDKSLPHMSSMITESLRQPIQQSFVQYFQDRLIPSFDQSCKVMFNQLNGTFEEGIQDLISAYKIDTTNSNNNNNNNTSNNNSNNNNNNVLADQLKMTVQTLLDVTSAMSNNIVDTQNKLLASHQGHQASTPIIHSLQKNTTPHTPHIPQHPPQQSLSPAPSHPHLHPIPPIHSPYPHTLPPTNPPQHFTAPSSPSFPPNASVHATLSRLVSMGRYEEAFDVALSASNLSLVTWLCGHIGDPRAVFSNQALSQPVLLSLVQQLGYDLESEVMLKFRWLHEVIPFLDTKSPNVPAHQIRDIMAQLRAKLDENYPKYADPANPYSASFKMLYHAVSDYQAFHLYHAPQ